MKMEDGRIVAVVPKRLGDALMCTPALTMVCRAFPDMQVDVIAESVMAGQVIEGNPGVANLHIAPSKAEAKSIAHTYSLGLNLHLAVSRKLDYLKVMQEQNPSLQLIYNDGGMDHEHQAATAIRSIAEQLDCVAPADTTGYQIFPSAADRSRVDEMLAGENIDPSKDQFVVFHIGCHSVAKNAKFWRKPRHRKVWPPERFIELADMLEETIPGLRFVLTGTEREKYLLREFKKASVKFVSLVDRTSVRELAALVGKAACVVTPDTGTMHITCAMKTPMVALFGPTEPRRTGPYPQNPLFIAIKRDGVEMITAREVCDSLIGLMPG